ncbi:MAG: hypothetical protein AB7M05_20880 [Alphaproteobacteria bacterium]
MNAAAPMSVKRAMDRPAGMVGHNRPVFRHLHPGVFVISMLGWVGYMVTYWLVFGLHLEGTLMLAVATVFFAVYFAMPLVLMRLRRGPGWVEKASFAAFLRGEIDTYTGRMSGMDALAQVAVLPVVISLGTMAIGVIVMAAR